jgi:hypothetical protein
VLEVPTIVSLFPERLARFDKAFFGHRVCDAKAVLKLYLGNDGYGSPVAIRGGVR